MSYSDNTINDPNFIKRYLQRSRFKDAVALFPNKSEITKVLDFGGGDGELCIQLANRFYNSKYICYEPTSNIHDEAILKTESYANISVESSIDSIAHESIDLVYALEVFEHLPPYEVNDAILRIKNLLKPDAHLIIGVPNELYLAAFYKGIFRLFRRHGDYDARIANIFSAFIGNPPDDRPIGEIAPGMNYYFHHMGFDYRSLRSQLMQHFNHMDVLFSPFRLIGYWGAPEIYFILNN